MFGKKKKKKKKNLNLKQKRLLPNIKVQKERLFIMTVIICKFPGYSPLSSYKTTLKQQTVKLLKTMKKLLWYVQAMTDRQVTLQ